MQVPTVLIGATQVDWKQFIESCQGALGRSPTRGLDTCATPTHRDPAAFVASLDTLNKPIEALREGRKRGLFRHYFFTFLFLFEETWTVKNINQETHLATYSIPSGRRSHGLVLVSGSVEQWHDAILAGCREQASWEFRAAMNGVYTMLLTMGFREALPYKKIDNRDDTFTLL